MEGKLRSIARVAPALPAGLLVLVGLVQPAVAYTAKGVGVVTALRGQIAVAHAPEVAAREARPPQEPLKFRDDVFFRDRIDTQRDSTAKLLLRGRSTFTIRELSRVELQEGVVPADPTRTRSIVSLLAGAFRAIVQRDLRPQDELEVQTPNAIAAIRGTDIVVEVYRDAAAPPLPPSVRYEPTVMPASFQVAQAPRVVSRWYVQDGEIEVEGLRARPGEGIEKEDNLPPRLFRFVPDFIERLAARFAISVVQGPLGAHQARNVAANQNQAAGDARPAGAFQPGGASPLIERAMYSLQAGLGREVVIDGVVSGTLTVGSPLSFTDAVITLKNGGTLLTSFVGYLSGYPGGSGSARFSGTVSGTACLLCGASATGSASFTINPTSLGGNSFDASLKGPLSLGGVKLSGPASGSFFCSGGGCSAGASGPVTGNFK